MKPEDLNNLHKKEKLIVLVSKNDKSDLSQNIFGGHSKNKNQKTLRKNSKARTRKAPRKDY